MDVCVVKKCATPCGQSGNVSEIMPVFRTMDQDEGSLHKFEQDV